MIQDLTDVQAYTWHGAPNNEDETSRFPEDTLTSFNPIPLNVEHERMANMLTVSVSGVTESRPWFSRNLIPDVKTLLRSEPVAAEETSTLPNGVSLSPSNHASGNSVRRQLEVPGWLRMSHAQDDLAGACVPATPDSVSSFDIIAESVALQFDIPVDSSTAPTLRLPNRATTRSLGTVTLYWQFSNESEHYQRVFQVSKDCVHPVILGRQFLKTTSTMSKNVYRVVEKVVEVAKHYRRQVLLVDTPATEVTINERFLGLINGKPIGGLADTCSELTIIKRSVAEDCGLTILEDDDYKTKVQFIDGSTAFTSELNVFLELHL
jgi:hypothetical protein